MKFLAKEISKSKLQIVSYIKPRSMSVCALLFWPYLWTDFETKGTYGLPMTQE